MQNTTVDVVQLSHQHGNRLRIQRRDQAVIRNEQLHLERGVLNILDVQVKRTHGRTDDLVRGSVGIIGHRIASGAFPCILNVNGVYPSGRPSGQLGIKAKDLGLGSLDLALIDLIDYRFCHTGQYTTDCQQTTQSDCQNLFIEMLHLQQPPNCGQAAEVFDVTETKNTLSPICSLNII